MKKTSILTIILTLVVITSGCSSNTTSINNEENQPTSKPIEATQKINESSNIPINAEKKQNNNTKESDETLNWQTYTNKTHNFSFKYPDNIFAYDAIDHTNGQIPDIAGFGYTEPGQYDPGNPVPDNKQGSARILVWDNVSQDLKTWIQTKNPNFKNLTEIKINGITALVNYSKDPTNAERNPMVTKTYYLKTNNKVIEIIGSSVVNEYSDTWIRDFDKIVATLQVEG